MPLSPTAAFPVKASRLAFVCAVGSVCSAVIFNSSKTHPPDKEDAPTVSLRQSAAPAAAPATPATPAPPPKPPAPVRAAESTPIDQTFSEAAEQLGMDQPTIAALSTAFGNRLDLRRDLKKGDTLSAVYDNQRSDPLAVRLTTGSSSHDVFLYREPDGSTRYYAKDGGPTHPVIDRYPVEFTRISSDFSLRRLDPVTHRWQSHDGVDLAAPIGTPVHATARGTVTFIGRQTGYGKVVMLENPPPYSTVYAHLSRFAKGIRNGDTVKRGQVIGYVGKTGWATGPHLHYEVHVDEVAEDPLTVNLPGDDRLQGEEQQRFAKEAESLSALL